jgi:hypothetical protein
MARIQLKARTGIAALTFAALAMPLPAAADAFVFSTGNPDGLMATATRPESPGKFEIETGDDFALTQETLITGAAFTGLIPSGASTSNISNVVVEIISSFSCRFQRGPDKRAADIFDAQCTHAGELAI